MTENAKMVKVKISMATGKDHEFEMPLEKATDLVSVVTHFDGQPNKQWIDAWDYTGHHLGQHLLNISRMEQIEFEPI